MTWPLRSNEQILDRLFDRFWRGDSDQPGTGLDLAIVAHLANRSGGTVAAANAPGGGLSIVVILASSLKNSAVE
jgi:two-component system OmpR family sensor kinase